MYKMDYSNVDPLHPEILSPEVLADYIRWRGFGNKITSTSKEQLLELYYDLIPLPQREPRDNRRGQFLSQKGNSHANQGTSGPSATKASSTSMPSATNVSMPSATNVSMPSAKLQNLSQKPLPLVKKSLPKTVSLSSSEPPSRLKPPPICGAESGKKMIKLNTKPSTNGDGVISLKRSCSSPVESKPTKLIRLNFRSPSAMDTKKSANPNNEETDQTPPKKKHKPITWP